MHFPDGAIREGRGQCVGEAHALLCTVRGWLAHHLLHHVAIDRYLVAEGLAKSEGNDERACGPRCHDGIVIGIDSVVRFAAAGPAIDHRHTPIGQLTRCRHSLERGDDIDDRLFATLVVNMLAGSIDDQLSGEGEAAFALDIHPPKAKTGVIGLLIVPTTPAVDTLQKSALLPMSRHVRR